jgi:2-keto-4-pentenoate hydratase
MLELRVVKLFTKLIQGVNIREDKTAAGYIVHPMQAHFWEAAQLPKNRSSTFVSLNNGDVLPSGATTKHRLKAVNYVGMSAPP